MLTEQVQSLSPSEQAALKDYFKWWSDTWLNTEANDSEAVEQALAKFYQRLGRKRPFVVWCDSPWQLAVLPFLLRLVCFHPDEAQRRLLRRGYDKGDIYKNIRLELSTNLNLPLWTQAYETLMAQITPEMELEFAYAATDPGWRPMISIERAIGLRLEKIMAEAHNDIRCNLSLTIIEQVEREMARIAGPAMRARMTLEQMLGFHVGRRFSDFNLSIRGSVRSQICPFVYQFIDQLGEDFSTQMARLLTHDYLPLEESDIVSTSLSGGPRVQSVAPSSRQQRSDTVMREAMRRMGVDPLNSELADLEALRSPVLQTSAEARLAQAMTDCTLTWANWSQDFFRVYLFPMHVLGGRVYRDEVREQLQELATLRTGAFMYVFNERVVFACKNPLAVHVDDRSTLHSYTQPSISFLDGYGLHSWRGVPVSKEFIDDPEKLTVLRIISESNLELRRVMIERYGMSRFLLDAGANIVAKDECGTLYSKTLIGDEPLVMVCVKNSTAEPDGSFKDYFLRVPPNVRTPREAVAWTFGMSPQEYEPSIQT